jgi:hypothetical protein
MASVLGFEPTSLPTSPLTMTLLVRLEPDGLRKLLKNGLRRGMSDVQLQAHLMECWNLRPDAPESTHLLNALDERGWLTRSADTGLWKTRLGSSTTP